MAEETGAHPTDRLPEYVRGGLEHPAPVEAHLASCDRCRGEVRVLRALASADPALEPEERERVWRRVAAAASSPGRAAAGTTGLDRAEPPSSRTGATRWSTAVWRTAAAAALVMLGVGVWQVNRQAGAAWEPTAALRGWERDLEAVRPAPEDVRMALGYGEPSAAPWGDPGDPWDDRGEDGAPVGNEEVR